MIISDLSEPQKDIERVSTQLELRDHLGALKVRCGIGRMNYKVAPGLYMVGNPDDSSPILVSANYKLTFDSLRKELSGIDCYMMILDTKGINVWCAAGKGTFGTAELIRRIHSTGLKDVTEQRTLILPQLGAPGVSAHEVKGRTGFEVKYGPVRASDLKEYLKNGMTATDEMRTVKFTTRDRIVLTPVEFVNALKTIAIVFGLMFLINLAAEDPFGMDDAIMFVGTVAMGTVLTPILLPILPGRAFSVKGWTLGILWAVFAAYVFGWFGDDIVVTAGYTLAMPSVSAYFAMNFTGSSTFTSPSGVTKEMRMALPFIICTIAVGTILLLAGRLF